MVDYCDICGYQKDVETVEQESGNSIYQSTVCEECKELFMQTISPRACNLGDFVLNQLLLPAGRKVIPMTTYVYLDIAVR